MKINTKKTKITAVAKKIKMKVKITINVNEIEQVKQFRYLGSAITENGRCGREIKTRIAMAKTAFNKRKTLLGRKLHLMLKKKLIKVLIWSVALYVADTWSLKKDEIQRLEALWLWRNMLNIKWTDKIPNRVVLQQTEEEGSLVAKIKERQKTWVGHVLRSGNLLQRVIEGRIQGKPIRGRKRIGMLSGLIGKEDYTSLKRRAQDCSQ